MMSERAKRLRGQSIKAKPYISAERAGLLTDFYQSGVVDRVSVPVARALAFKYLLENKMICINEGELIVGERGPSPKATPTYPELCCHSLEDLEVLNSRERTPFLVDEDTKRIYREKVIPFWKGKSIRERVFAAMSEEWRNAFDSGVLNGGMRLIPACLQSLWNRGRPDMLFWMTKSIIRVCSSLKKRSSRG